MFCFRLSGRTAAPETPNRTSDAGDAGYHTEEEQDRAVSRGSAPALSDSGNNADAVGPAAHVMDDCVRAITTNDPAELQRLLGPREDHGAPFSLDHAKAQKLLHEVNKIYGAAPPAPAMFRAIIAKTWRDNPTVPCHKLFTDDLARIVNTHPDSFPYTQYTRGETAFPFPADVLGLIGLHLDSARVAALKALSTDARVKVDATVTALKLRGEILRASDAELKDFFTKRPAITQLDFSNLRFASSVQVQRILDAIPNPEKITSIDLTGQDLKDINLGRFTKLQTLRAWDHSVDKNTTADDMASLVNSIAQEAKEQTLQTLELMDMPVSKVRLDGCLVLQTLNLSEARGTNADDLAAVWNSLPQVAKNKTLQTLLLIKTPLSKVRLDGCLVLRTLDVCWAQSTSAAELAAVWNSLPKVAKEKTLQTLVMKYAPLSEIRLYGCLVLRMLDMSRAQDTSADDMATVWESLPLTAKEQTLEILNLENTQLSKVRFDGCLVLEKIDMSEAKGTSADELAAVWNSLPEATKKQTLQILLLRLTPLSKVRFDGCLILQTLDVSQARETMANDMAAVMDSLPQEAKEQTLQTLLMGGTQLSKVKFDRFLALLTLNVFRATGTGPNPGAALRHSLPPATLGRVQINDQQLRSAEMESADS